MAHKLPFLTERTCTGCGALKPRAEFRIRNGNPISRCLTCGRRESKEHYRALDPEEQRVYRREYEQTESGKAARARVVSKLNASGWMQEHGRRKHLRRKFGITEDQFNTLLIGQGYRCAICRRERKPGERAFSIDHDHVTGQIRGLLCSSCNTGLGSFYDDPQFMFTAITYLTRPLPLVDLTRTYPVKGSRDEKLRATYNLSLDSFNNLLNRQGGICAICHGKPQPKTKGFFVDHVHGSKTVRGILCSCCNFGIGYFQHNPIILASAVWYLHSHSQQKRAA